MRVNRLAPQAFAESTSPNRSTRIWRPGGRRGTALGYEHGFTHQVVDLLEAIAAGENPAPSFDDGLHVQRVLDAVERSSLNDNRWTADSVAVQLRSHERR